jgi:hypothetical protein
MGVKRREDYWARRRQERLAGSGLVLGWPAGYCEGCSNFGGEQDRGGCFVGC